MDSSHPNKVDILLCMKLEFVLPIIYLVVRRPYKLFNSQLFVKNNKNCMCRKYQIHASIKIGNYLA